MKVFLVDDHALISQGIEQILGKDFQVVGKATTGQQALMGLDVLQPDIVILDLRIPQDIGDRDEVSTGLKLLQTIKERAPQARILVYTSINATEEPAALARSREAGAAGFLGKGEPPERLIEAIRLVAQGRLAFTLEQDELIRKFQEWERARPKLSPRERIILLKIREGLQENEIARELGNKESTIRTHVRDILKKLDARNRLEAIRKAQEWDLL